MILTDKAKQDFLDYYWENYIGKTRCISKKGDTEEFFNSLIQVLKGALIIEWFRDKAYIHLQIYPFGNKINWCYNLSDWKNDPDVWFYERLTSLKVREDRVYERFDSYHEALHAAIEKANEIYNSKQ